ncbi:MAG: transglycosylase SLT domain-containing protein [Acidimicrobiia bacterium]|nr:transglycosylase SLT domain-containing protein [Acidimicrobiia bacterium]
MQLRRLSLLLLAGLLVPALVPGAALRASAQTEVDRAADEVARADAERAEAQRLVDAWAARRGTVLDRVIAALFSLEQTNTQLETATFEAFDLREEIFDAEARVARLREITENRAVVAYMTGTASVAFSVWSASNFEQSVLLEETAATAQRADTRELANLIAQRDRLADLQEGYRRTQERLQVLREDAEIQGHTLQELFAAVDADYVLSYEGLRQADADYQRAVSESEAAQRRRAARAGVEPWRPLVQQYFPTALVGQALRVMRCESGGNPDAVHPESDATGLFQFLAGTWAFSSVQAGFAGASRFDAEANVAAAAWLVGYSIRTDHPRGAWGHWVCQP